MARTKLRPLGHCSRCTRACWKDADDFSRWNGSFNKGVLVGLICPGCQTLVEHTEAEVHSATLDYGSLRRDGAGQLRIDPVGGNPTA